MPDVHPESYNHEDVASFVRALESSEQYSAEYIHKMATAGQLYLDSGILDLNEGQAFYGYVENPSTNDYSIIAMEPKVEVTGIIEFHAYFNADVDTTTFNSTVLNNLSSGVVDDFPGDTWNGFRSAVTVNDEGSNFYSSIVGTGKKSGATGGGNLIAKLEPGDNILFKFDNNGTASSSQDVVASFQAPYHEQNKDFSL